MSNIAIKGATTGTGTFTIESPATNTDRTLTLPDEAGTVLTSASSIPSSQVTGLGIDVVDQWYMDTTFTGNASPGTNYTRLGLHIGASGMSVASGIWTFPSTGIWQIKYTQNMTETSTCRYARVFCKVSTDGGSTFPNETQETFTNLFSSAATYQFITNVFILDVTSTANVKIRFDYNDVNNDMQWIGNSKSTYEFIRLGDT